MEEDTKSKWATGGPMFGNGKQRLHTIPSILGRAYTMAERKEEGVENWDQE
jgi:hypothetical protein